MLHMSQNEIYLRFVAIITDNTTIIWYNGRVLKGTNNKQLTEVNKCTTNSQHRTHATMAGLSILKMRTATITFALRCTHGSGANVLAYLRHIYSTILW